MFLVPKRVRDMSIIFALYNTVHSVGAVRHFYTHSVTWDCKKLKPRVNESSQVIDFAYLLLVLRANYFIWSILSFLTELGQCVANRSFSVVVLFPAAYSRDPRLFYGWDVGYSDDEIKELVKPCKCALR